MMLSHYRDEPLNLSEHNYLVIDRLKFPSRFTELPVIELVNPLLAPQAHLYPWLLPLHALESSEWSSVLEQLKSVNHVEDKPLGYLLIKSSGPDSLVRQHLVDALFINDGTGKKHILRYYDPKVLFHLRWMLPPWNIATMLGTKLIRDWTFWLDGNWHTLSFSEDVLVKPESQNLHSQFEQLQRISMINEILLSFPVESDLYKREQFSQRINNLLETANRECGLTEPVDLQSFACHSIQYGDQFYQTEAIQKILCSKIAVPGLYHRITRGWSTDEWGAVSSGHKLKMNG